jgi:outer membrane lipoprotein-sorting protein
MTGRVLLLVALLVGPAVAAPPDAATVARRMKAALEPARASVRRLDITISSENGESTRYTAAQARKQTPDGDAMLTVLLAPEATRGIAVVVRERPQQDDVLWVYLPAVRRVRKIVPAARYEAFVHSDFTYADLGFVSMRETYKLLPAEKVDGATRYVLQETPRDRWQYARIVDHVAPDTWLPLRREFYDPSNTLWKVEELADVTAVDGVPTPTRVRMQDVQQGGSSEIHVSAVRYDVDVPDTLFEPEHLPDAATSATWPSSGP